MHAHGVRNKCHQQRQQRLAYRLHLVDQQLGWRVAVRQVYIISAKGMATSSTAVTRELCY